MTAGNRAVSMWMPINIVGELYCKQSLGVRVNRARTQRIDAHLCIRREGMHAAIDNATWPVTIVLTRLMVKGVVRYKGNSLVAALRNVRQGIADALNMRDDDTKIKWEYEQIRHPRGGTQVTFLVLVNGLDL